MLCSVLYSSKSNLDEETRLNSTGEVEVEPTPVKEKPKPPIVEKRMVTKKNKS